MNLFNMVCVAVLALLLTFAQNASGQTLQKAEDAAAALGNGLTCRWVGTAPFCTAGCEPGENEIEKSACADGACCWSGWKLKCCKPIVSNILVQTKAN